MVDGVPAVPYFVPGSAEDGWEVGGRGPRSFRMTPFIAMPPMTTRTWWARLRAAVWSTLAAWAVVVGLVLPAIVTGISMKYLHI